jgi:recombination associated protein RdgC
MLFKNLVLFQLPEGFATTADLEKVFGEHRLRPCGPMDRRTEGFISPFGDQPTVYDEDGRPVRVDTNTLALTHEIDGRVLFVLGFEEKVLPASVINRKIKDEVARIQATENRKVGGKEKKKIKEEVTDQLLPKAFVKPGRLQGYIDQKEGWVVFNTSGVKGAENALSLIRKALGSLPAVPVPAENGRLLLTQWLLSQTLPEGLEIGDECELKDPGEGGGTVRCSKQDLSSDEVLDHLRAGKQVTRLSFRYKERMAFALNETLGVSKIKLDDVKEEGESDPVTTGDAQEKLDAEFALMTLEFSVLFDDLRAWFEFSRPDRGAMPDESDEG